MATPQPAISETLTEDGKDVIVVRKHAVGWVGQAFSFLDEEGEFRWRVDEHGAEGVQALHITPGTNAEGTYQPPQAVWIDPRVDCFGVIQTNPPTEVDGVPIPWTKDYYVVADVRQVGAPTIWRLHNKGWMLQKVSVLPTAADLKKGEHGSVFDPATGTFRLYGRKNDGTLATKVL